MRPTRTRLMVRGLVVGALLFAGCARSSRHQTITLSGSSTIAPLATEIGLRFEELHPGVRVEVQTGGSSRGIADVRAGLVAIGMVSRMLADDEHDLVPVVIARDGIALIVHADNPITELDTDQVRGIYTGAIESWSDLAPNPSGLGPITDDPITVVHKAEGRATLAVFLEAFDLDSETIRPDVVIGDNEQGIKTVASDPNAIGYVSIGAAELNAAAGTPIRLLPFRGVAASRTTLAAGEYPIARPLLLITAAPARGLIAEYLDFARSPAVADLIEGLSFVPAGEQQER